jgi:hypothetical protein
MTIKTTLLMQKPINEMFHVEHFRLREGLLWQALTRPPGPLPALFSVVSPQKGVKRTFRAADKMGREIAI